MESFDELGVSPELLEALSAEGMEVPTAFQQVAIPVLMKGNHVLAQAGPGAGTLVAYGVPLLENIDVDANSPRALVLAPSSESALRLARSFSRFSQATGHRIAALGSSWALPELSSILFATPEELVGAVRTSSFSLEEIQTVVVDGFSSLPPADRDALEILFESLPKESQKILLSQPLTEEAEAFGKAHLQKAVHLPPQAAQIQKDASPKRGEVAYRVTGEEKDAVALDTVATFLRGETRHVLIFFRTDDQAADVGDLLALHGFLPGAPGDESLPVWLAVD
ncbi:DEAD/DEAH box helicase, partial [Gemmatimonadota bacterium]